MGDGLTRLTEPLVREDGRLRPASWEEALTRAAAGFAAARDKGPNAFGMFSCSKTTNEMNFMAQKFARAVMHSNNIDSCNRTCPGPSVAGLATVFGAGGGTSSYREAEETELVILWGSNARETHPIFFHHLLRGVRNGARLVAVDPRRTSSAEGADVWLGIDVGSDIALANAMARVIIHAGLANTEFIARATTGYEEFAACVEAYPLERAEKETGVPAAAIKEVAHAYGRADKGMICWTLGITEHHNATDNVLALINLALLTGKVGRYGCGLNPLRGQNNVQGGGDMGAIPARMPGFQDLQDLATHAKFSRAWGGATFPAKRGYPLSEIVEAMEHGEPTAAYIIGENPARSEADQTRAVRLLSGLDHPVGQDLFLTPPAALAHRSL